MWSIFEKISLGAEKKVCLDGMIYRCLFKYILVITSVSSLISLLSFCLANLPIGKSEVLKFLTSSMWGLMCYLSFRSVSFTYEGALVFGT